MSSNKEKILITGGKGLLGSMLASVLSEKGYEVFALGSGELNITDDKEIDFRINELEPNFLINCAAYTNVDLAEDEKEKAMLINAYAPGKLAKAAKNYGICFIHISTDYVFGDNNPSGHLEDDGNTFPSLNTYGESKRIGEIEVMNEYSESYIARVQWSFGPGGKNIVDTMLTLAKTRNELNIVDDEIGVPTYTKYMARQIEYMILNQKNLKPGFYHIVSEGKCSRFDQVEFVFEKAGIQIKLNRIKLAEYPRKAKIPNFSILINSKLPKLPTWKEGITEYLNSKKS